MSDSDSDSDNFWGDDSSKTLHKSTVATPTSAKKGEIKLSFSIPSLPTSPAQDYAIETENKDSDLSSNGKPPRYPVLTLTVETSSDESSLYQDEDKSDLHEILDSLLNFESIIGPQPDDVPEKAYAHSLSLASLDAYGQSGRREEVQRENFRLAKQIKQSKSCLGKSTCLKSSAAISAANQSINRTKLSRLEQENLNLLKRIQSAKSTKAISRKEHDKHFASHKVYGKISSKQRQPNLSATPRVASSLSQPEWNI